VRELAAQLARGDTSTLAALEVTRDNRGEALRLGPQAPYYLAHHFRAIGRPETARELLRLQWQRGPAPWSEESVLELLREHLDEGRYAAAEAEARTALRRLRDHRRLFAGERFLVEALYWQENDEEVLERLEGLRAAAPGAAVGPRVGEPPGPESSGVWDDELDLFVAVAGCRLGRSGWQAQFLRLFVESRAGTLHGRAFTFLQRRGQVEDFGAPEQALLRAKLELAGGTPAVALALLEEALPALAGSQSGPAQGSLPRELEWRTLLFETAGAGFSSGEHRRAAALLEALAPELPAEEGLYARELAARLLRRAGAWQESLEILRRVVEDSPSVQQRDRAAWFILDMLRRSDFEAFLGELVRLAPGWHDPAYFADLIELQTTSLVSEGRWRDLERMRQGLSPGGPPAARSRLAYLAGRAAALRLPGGPAAALATSLLREARDLDPGGYHSILAQALVGPPAGAPRHGGPGTELPAHDETDLESPGTEGPAEGDASGSPEEHGAPEPEPPQAGTATAAQPSAVAPAEDLEILRGFLSFGLVDKAYELLTRRVDARGDGQRALALPVAPVGGVFPAELLREGAERFNELGEYLRSIRLINRYLGQAPGPATSRDFELLYPLGYREAIEALSGRYDIAPELLFALVREESHFDSGIVSRSGAVGLMQLMEAAAADSARRLRMEGYDLRDPEANLALGTEHLSRLLSRLDSVPKALMAYNAGLSRVRTWERRYPGLPGDLLVEALPFAETRGYVRKILVSAAQYGRLYYGVDLGTLALRFYPELVKTEE